MPDTLLSIQSLQEPTDPREACPVCGSPSCSTFDYIFGTDGVRSELGICHDCGAITNRTAYDLLRTETVKNVQHTDYYLTDSAELAETSDLIAPVFDYFSKATDLPYGGVFCDFGCGFGRAAMYASRLFRKSIACDWDTRAAEFLAAREGRPANYEIVNDIERVRDPIDVLFMWHTLEHLPRPCSFWRGQAHRLAEGATVILQVPLYRPGNVNVAHYVFFTERTLRYWCAALNAEPLDFGYDDVRGFISLVAKCRPSARAAH
jgi:SAM-dependent methyltransferase